MHSFDLDFRVRYSTVLRAKTFQRLVATSCSFTKFLNTLQVSLLVVKKEKKKPPPGNCDYETVQSIVDILILDKSVEYSLALNGNRIIKYR